MTAFRSASFMAWMIVAALGTVLVGGGCSSGLGSGLIGRAGHYNYSPSVIQSGEMRQYWWCGDAVNPTNQAQDTDTIQYESVNLTTNATYGPVTVLAETAGAWDSVYTCNPKVIGGVFRNPLGDGQTYQYAMYYVATAADDGSTNSIGVAFSNDGITWKKYPDPVIRSTVQGGGYGVGQPAVYNRDGVSGISLFYEDWTPTIHHVAATSPDGVHFSVLGTLTAAGLNADNPGPSWGDMAYDPASEYWYAVFNSSQRAPATTGGVTERGSFGFVLYRIPNDALLTGATPWQELHSIDTNMTGFESNFLGGFVRDPFGNLNVGVYPTIQMYFSVSNPRPAWDASPADVGSSASPDNWDIGSVQWVPNEPAMALNRYFNGSYHMVTTGWVSTSGGFALESMLGHIYESPQQGATVPFYGCKNGSKDYFVSLDPACEGQRILGKNGYGYGQPVASLKMVALYRCKTKRDHFVSPDPKCEGQTTEELLGYVLP